MITWKNVNNKCIVESVSPPVACSDIFERDGVNGTTDR